MCVLQTASKRVREEAGNPEEEAFNSEVEAQDSISLPPWVVCKNTWALWRKGKQPPAWLQLSPAFVSQLAVIREWGELEMGLYRCPGNLQSCQSKCQSICQSMCQTVCSCPR